MDDVCDRHAWTYTFHGWHNVLVFVNLQYNHKTRINKPFAPLGKIAHLQPWGRVPKCHSRIEANRHSRASAWGDPEGQESSISGLSRKEQRCWRNCRVRDCMVRLFTVVAQL
jgi:hypothetical protein